MLQRIGENANQVKYQLQSLSTEKKNEALFLVAEQLEKNTERILSANSIDIELAQKNMLHPGLIDRLCLTEDRIKAMADGLRQIITLEDPIGEVLEEFTRPAGLKITKCRVPLGVIGMIYEARPNVTVDAFGLCFKTGNVVILKGGSDAMNSNRCITEIIQEALVLCDLPQYFIQLITSTEREVANQFMKMNQYIDVLIPRGGAGLIQAVVSNSTIPVIETGTGNCHIYLDKSADMEKAISIILNAKTQRIGVCNACESLVIHKDLMEKLPLIEEELVKHNVEIRGDENACKWMTKAVLATEEDFGKEYLDYIISVKIVDGIEEAIKHINCYNTKHSDAIVSEDVNALEQFLNEVDSACVYANTSTRFTDGFEFGFGAEIGISTQKLHARGPMGLRELTSYKYKVCSDGAIRA